MASVPVCECGAEPYWVRQRVESSRATLNTSTLDWVEDWAGGTDTFECGECGEAASEDNDEKLQGLNL